MTHLLKQNRGFPIQMSVVKVTVLCLAKQIQQFDILIPLIFNTI